MQLTYSFEFAYDLYIYIYDFLDKEKFKVF